MLDGLARRGAAGDSTAPSLPSHAARIAEIQGLRGIAVLGVLLFHVGLSGARGGFLGVDVFFVISGFVITSLLRRRLDAETFSFADFYFRRAWRLLPALLVVLLSTATVFCLLTPTSLNTGLLPSLLMATVGLSNFYFSASVDYFDSGVSNPLLHTWSLGVEEQFYLIFPWLAFWLSRSRVDPKRVFAVMLLAGFAAAVIATERATSSAFYLPWFRAWEFIAGALLAHVDRLPLRGTVGRAASMTGFAMLMASLAWYGEGYIFPGVGAVAPVLGTVLLIAGAGQRSIVNRLLASPPLRLLGDASYSLYLAHWPVVCLVGMFFPLAQIKFQLAALAASVLIGWLIWRWVERPIMDAYRPAPSGQWLMAVPVGMGLAACALTLIALGADKLWKRNPDALEYLQATQADPSLFSTGVCFLTFKVPFENFDRARCLGRSGEKSTMLVVGDSLAANLTVALKDRYPDLDVLQATSVDYRPGHSEKWPATTAQLNAVVSAELEKSPQTVQRVLVFARWDADDLAPLVSYVDRSRKQGIEVTVVGPSPEFYFSLPLILAYSAITGVDLVPVFEKSDRRALDQEFARAFDKKAEYVSMMNLVCPDGGGHNRKCTVVGDGRSLFSDKVHLTRSGASHFVSLFPSLTDLRVGR